MAVKTVATVGYYEEWGQESTSEYLSSIVERMPKQVQDVFDRSFGDYCAGEIIIWDSLTEDGLDSLVAAEAAVLFPAPIEFHPFATGQPDQCAKDIYNSLIAKGLSPLDALLNLVDVVKPYGVKGKDFSRRKEKFKAFVYTKNPVAYDEH